MKTQSNFLERARALGHSEELLSQGIPVTSNITVKNVDELRKVIRIFNPDYGPQLAQQLFGNIPLSDPKTDGSAYGTLRRVNEFLYSDSELSPEDRARIKPNFPVQVATTSDPSYTISTPTIITTSGGAPWGTNNLNIGTLTFTQGGYISVYGVALNIVVDDIVRNGTSGGAMSDINILGVTGTNGATGGTGTTGATGSGGTKSSCTVAGSEPGDAGGPGGTGSAGNTGSPGGPGNTATPSYQASIKVTGTLTMGSGANPKFSVYTCSGTGGSGGQGGAGGQGGTGGSGADGANCECTGTNGGNAGNGGPGGTGGAGGNAGAAVNAAGNVVINIPQAYFALISSSSLVAPPGNFGNGGAPGAGGAPGGYGSSGKHSSSGNSGNTGTAGGTGSYGTASSVTGAPGLIQVNPF